MRAEAGVRTARRGRFPRVSRGRLRSVRSRWSAPWTLAALLAVLLAVGVLFAGSPERIPAGVTLAGVNVGGLTAEEAEKKLAAKATRMASAPVVFTVGGKRWAVTPADLDVRVDWRAAVAEALETGGGAVPFRGLKRVKVRLLGADLEPHADVYEPGLRYWVAGIARAVDVSARDASIVLRGLQPVVVPAEVGRELARREAEGVIVAALAGFERRRVPLPVGVESPAVTAADLVPVAAQVRTALSAPVRLGFKDAHWPIRPAELAKFLQLPAGGSRELRVAGPGVDRYFEDLNRGVARKPVSADFELLAGGKVRVAPGRDGRALDVAATADAVLAAALSTTRREAELVVRAVEPKLTTERASSLGITRVLSTFGTPYSGSFDRIRNLQLAVTALDGTLIAPGATFSFNKEVGPRTEERGYRPAPVIVNGEYEDGIGGGVSQVATTVFNAVWEAGLKITARTAHALYISRYPLGRDATVNYPDVDLRFRNDTRRWLLVRATYGDTGIAITLLGAPTRRRVVSATGDLEEIARPKVEREPDPTLHVGEKVVEDAGEPARAVTVTRTVYVGDEVLYRETWRTAYRSEPKIVRVGTIPKPAEKKPKANATTTTAPTGTGTTATTTNAGDGN